MKITKLILHDIQYYIVEKFGFKVIINCQDFHSLILQNFSHCQLNFFIVYCKKLKVIPFNALKALNLQTDN